MPTGTFLRGPDFSGLLRENPMHLFYNDAVFNDDTFGTGLSGYFPSGGTARRKIVLTDTYFEDIFGTDEDHFFEVKVIIRGRFERTEDGWTGQVNKIIFKGEGDVRAVIGRFGGELDLSDFHGSSPGSAWNAFALEGFRGRLSGESDYAGLSLGDDRVNGGRGNDWINGGLGDDTLIGGAGADYLTGADGNDVMIGGRGNDTLSDGSAESDPAAPHIMRGGNGRDHIVFNTFSTATGGRHADSFDVTNTNFYERYWISDDSGSRYEDNVGSVITDFNRRQGDTLTVDPFIVFELPDEARYRGAREFSGSGAYFEVRMEDGVVEIDADGDGEANSRVFLEGTGTFRGSLDWFVLPDGLDFV